MFVDAGVFVVLLLLVVGVSVVEAGVAVVVVGVAVVEAGVAVVDAGTVVLVLVDVEPLSAKQLTIKRTQRNQMLVAQ